MNPEGGKAATLHVRMPNADIRRLGRLAKRRRVSRSHLVREAVTATLDATEQDTGPPTGG
jgi:Arc/MetJ-type ribon-helix-helix transcriptional regulator